METYKCIAWNVNQYSNEIHTYLLDYVNKESPDIIFLSETKVNRRYLINKFNEFENYNYIVNQHTPEYIHGVAMLIKKSFSVEKVTLKYDVLPRNDNRDNSGLYGRLISIKINNTYIIGVYVPNSGQKQKYLDYRINHWDECFFKNMMDLKSKGNVIIMGDLNVTKNNMDISNPKRMKKYAGCLDIEQNNFVKLLHGGFIDTYRRLNNNKRFFTWRSPYPQSTSAIRLDYFLISAQKYIIEDVGSCETNLSDHIPITAILSF